MKIRSVSLCLILPFGMLSFYSCSHSGNNPVQPAFYYWQSNFHLNARETQTLDSLHIKKLFIKFFDVTWDHATQQPIPAASIDISEEPPAGVNCIPVIFITNETLKNIRMEDVSTLAFKCSKKISDILGLYHISSPEEIQLDCDWSEATKDKYFALIRDMKTFPAWKNIRWSATIRLHQVKYFEKTGVPPVDRGMLMFYNMGNIEDRNSENSIFDEHIAEDYVQRIKDYPLPMDAGIALFSWGLLFENGELLKIFYPLNTQDLAVDSLFEATNAHTFRSKKDFYFNGQFLTVGDEIRVEEMTPALSLQSARLLKKNFSNDSTTIILYHLDSTILTHYSNEDLENIYAAFR